MFLSFLLLANYSKGTVFFYVQLVIISISNIILYMCLHSICIGKCEKLCNNRNFGRNRKYIYYWPFSFRFLQVYNCIQYCLQLIRLCFIGYFTLNGELPYEHFGWIILSGWVINRLKKNALWRIILYFQNQQLSWCDWSTT